MKHFPSPTALLMFVEAARHSSFARAAEALNVTQPAISKQIATLEARVGTPLFRRRHRAVDLNEAGEAYLQFAKQVLVMLEAGQSEAISRSDRESLIVAIDHEFLNFAMVPKLNALRAALPDVDIVFLPEVTNRLLPTCDLAITFGHPSHRDFWSERFCRFSVFAVGTPDLIKSSANPLKELPLLHDADTYWWDAILRAENVERNTQGVFMGSGAAALRAAARGAGLAVGDDLLCADALSSGQLIRASAHSLPGRVDFWLSIGKARKEKPAARKFVEWLKDGHGPHLPLSPNDHSDTDS